MSYKIVVLLSVFYLLLACVWGCTNPLTIQALSGTSPVAFSFIGKGKDASFWLARYDDVIEATLRAGNALSLDVEEKKIQKDKALFHYTDGKGKKLDILIERRTETMTYVQFDVGLFGSISMGRLMVRQIIFEITKAGDFLQNWSPTEESPSKI